MGKSSLKIRWRLRLRKFLRMLAAERSHSRAKLNWSALVAIILVPVILVCGLLAASWHIHSRLHQSNGAIVNQDKAVTINGKLVPLGREFAAGLIDSSDTISWKLTEEKDASAGLKSGLYSAVVTIPANFSARATSFTKNKAADADRAVVNVATAQNSPFGDIEIAKLTAAKATRVLNTDLTKKYLENIYIGFNTLGDQFGKISNGAQRLSTASTTLAEGAQKSVNGSHKLSSGLDTMYTASSRLIEPGEQITNGMKQLNDGLNKLSANSKALREGALKLSVSTEQLSQGATQANNGMSAMTVGINRLSTGLNTLRNQLNQATNFDVASIQKMINNFDAMMTEITQALGKYGISISIKEFDAEMDKFIQEASQLSTQFDSAVANLKDYANGTRTLSISAESIQKISKSFLASCQRSGSTLKQCQAMLPEVQKNSQDIFNQGVKAGSSALIKALSHKINGIPIEVVIKDVGHRGVKFAITLRDSVDSLAKLVNQLKLAKGTNISSNMLGKIIQLKQGVNQLADGATILANKSGELASGIAKLQTGSQQLSAGASTLSTKVNAYTSGADKIATHSPELSSGVQTYVGGVDKLVDGIHQATKGANNLTSGLIKLSDGSLKYANRAQFFSSSLEKGADKLPRYSERDRNTLAGVVSAPISSGNGDIGPYSRSLTALLVTLGVWLSALILWIVVRAIPSRILTSTKPNWKLLLRVLFPGIVVMIISVVFFTGFSAWVVELSIRRTLGLGLLLFGLGIAFILINHALTAWLHSWGRVISVAFITAAVAIGLLNATPAPLRWTQAISPLQPAVTAVSNVIAGYSPGFSSSLQVIVWTAVAVVASITALTAKRQIKAHKVK